MVPAMPVTRALLALLFDIAHFAARGYFAVAAHEAAAGEGGEAEKTNQTHGGSLATRWSKLCTAEPRIYARLAMTVASNSRQRARFFLIIDLCRPFGTVHWSVATTAR